MKTLVRWHSNERVELGDIDDATGLLDLFDALRKTIAFQMPEGRAVGVDNGATETRILSGWDLSNINAAAAGGGGFLTLNRGAGIFKLLEEGELRFGLLFGNEGNESENIDFTGLANGDYAIWIRAVHIDGTQENRVKWDATNTTEIVENVNTRRVASWQQTVTAFNAAAPSGGDWVKIWKVTKAAGPTISATADMRHFYFEGDADTAYGAGQWASEWGEGANDRNADRALYGIQDLHKWVHMVQRQLKDIVGASSGGHWSAIPRSLTELAPEHLASGKHGSINTLDILMELLDNSRGLDMRATSKILQGASNPMMQLLSPGQTTPVLVMEAYGRLAEPHRFRDDFMYNSWFADASIPEPYSSVLTNISGNVDTLCSASASSESLVATVGGSAVLITGANGGDSVSVYGPTAWVVDTDKSLIRFMIRACVDGGVATNKVWLGMASGSGGTWEMTFESDLVVNGDANWRLRVSDGVTTERVDTGVLPVADVMQNFYLAVTDKSTIQCWVSTIPVPAPVTLNLTAALDMDAIATTIEPFAHLGNNGTATARKLYIDYWDFWDDQALNQINGRQG